MIGREEAQEAQNTRENGKRSSSVPTSRVNEVSAFLCFLRLFVADSFPVISADPGGRVGGKLKNTFCDSLELIAFRRLLKFGPVFRTK